MNLQITILGDPVPYKRERINMKAVARWMSVKMKGNPYRFGPLTYTPYECKKWQNSIKSLLRSRLPQKGQIGVWATWFRAFKWTDSIAKLRPDVDNIQKNLLDALQDAVYVDDAYVCDLHLTTRFGAAVPMLRVNVRTLGTKEKMEKMCIAPLVKAKLVKAVKRQAKQLEKS